MMEKLLAHRNTAIPSLRKVRPEASRKLETVFEKMVAKEPQSRHQSMTEVIAELEACLTPQERAASLGGLVGGAPGVGHSGRLGLAVAPSPAVLPAGPKGKRLWIAAAVVLVAAIAVAGVVVLPGLLMPEGKPVAASGPSPQSQPVSTPDTGKPPDTGKLPDTGKRAGGVDDAWIKMVSGMPGKAQIAAFAEKMKDVNPAYKGRGDHRFDKTGALVEVMFETDNVTDLSPVRGLPSLFDLRCYGSDVGRGKLGDLSPLKGTPIRYLNCSRNPSLSDLSPLKGMSLTRLNIGWTAVSELSALGGMKLEHLDITGTRVADLSPLRGMPLVHLHLRRTSVTDLSTLRGMPLEEIVFELKTEAQAEVLRSLPSLKRINDSQAPAVLKKTFK
jgi:hypothetical protein